MKFDSESGREAGKKGRRGKSKNIEEMRSLVKNLVESNIEQMQEDISSLEPKDRLDCLTRLMRYVMPTLKAMEVREVESSVEMQDFDITKIYDPKNIE